MITLTTENFKDIFSSLEDITYADGKFKINNNSNIPSIIDFNADWCGPCRHMHPVLEEISEQYKEKLKIYSVDVDAEPDLAQKFQIRSIPALLYVDIDGNGTMQTGMKPRNILNKNIQDMFGIE